MNKYFNPTNYIDFAINRSLAWLESMIRKWENPYLEKFGSQPLKHQPIFIIGAPRTGSTILYQTLTNLYDVLYVDNLVCKFHKNFFFGFWLSNKLFGAKPHNNYEADHGSTKGLHSPSECGKFWYRWLPTDHHFIDYDEITPLMVDEIRREIAAVINYFDRPLLFKNLNAGQRLRLITRCFPKAKFIFITREPVYTAQSILKSKRVLGLNHNIFWSIMPSNIKELDNMDGYEQIVKQIYYLESQIVKDSALVANNCFYTIQLNDLSVPYISELARSFGFDERVQHAEFPNIHVNKNISIDEHDFMSLKKQVDSLDWTFMCNNPKKPVSTLGLASQAEIL